MDNQQIGRIKTMRYRVTMTAFCAVAVAAAAVAAQAQEPGVAAKQEAERKMTFERVAVESRVTRNAPYSAEATTESVQVLADGNRIVTKNTTRIVRDSEGRMRREQLNPAGTDVVSVSIIDPVAGGSYVLDPASHLAYRNGMIFSTAAGVAMAGGGPGVATTVTMTRTAEGPAKIMDQAHETKLLAEGQTLKAAKLGEDVNNRVYFSGSGNAGYVINGQISTDIKNAVREDLGQQVIEGVTATGTRTTTVIAAGAIGNEQPIKIVSEQWYSPDLQVLVLTKHNDPRVGETVYRLVGIVRAEPVRSLFDLPSDYTLHESTIRRQER
jgi:hypothetical protein